MPHKLRMLLRGRAGTASLALGVVIFIFAFVFMGESPDRTPDSLLAQMRLASEAAPGQSAEEEFLPAEAAPGLEGTAEAPDASDAEIAAELSVMNGVIGRGDTVGGILQAWLTAQEISELDNVCKSVHSLRRVKQGQAYAVHSQDGDFVSFEYEIDNDSRLLVTRGDSGFNAEKLEIEYEIRLHRVEGEIKSSLFQAMSDAGETPILAAQLAGVFAWEINFIRDLRVGDRFSLLVEKRYRDGEFKDYGKLLAASFINQSDKYEAFLFRDDDGNSQYFSRDGQSMRRAFLKAPLSYTRISSGYTNRRLHPVTMDWKAHPAIDYAAPIGTPVKSVGKGKIIFMGSSKSAGNYITVEHMNGYQTMYLHLNGFAKGLSKNSKVAQGQVIGFVGQTGYATGPHLDFRMKKDGTYLNPLRVLSPRETPVSKDELPAYQDQVEMFLAFLEDRRNLAEYKRELLTNIF